MKNQVNPAVFVVCIVVVLAILMFVGWRAAAPPAPSDGPKPTATAARPTEINGHPVPNNVPVDYMQKEVNKGTGGYQGYGGPARSTGGVGTPPSSMTGGAQHP